MFVLSAGKAEATYHYIPTAGSPVKVPSRCMPAHYKEEKEKQMQHMFDVLESANAYFVSLKLRKLKSQLSSLALYQGVVGVKHYELASL